MSEDQAGSGDLTLAEALASAQRANDNILDLTRVAAAVAVAAINMVDSSEEEADDENGDDLLGVDDVFDDGEDLELDGSTLEGICLYVGLAEWRELIHRIEMFTTMMDVLNDDIDSTADLDEMSGKLMEGAPPFSAITDTGDLTTDEDTQSQIERLENEGGRAT